MKMILFALPLLLLSACASMSVQVDVMNPTYAKATATEAGLRLEANQLASGSHQQADDFVTQTWGEYERFRLQCIDELLVAAQKIQPAADKVSDYNDYLNDLRRLPASGRTSMEGAREAARRRLHRQDGLLLTEIQKSHPDEVGLDHLGEPIAGNLKAALLERRRVFAAEADEVRSWIEGQRRECQAAVGAALNLASNPPAAATAEAGQTAKKIDQQAVESKNQVEQIKIASVVGSGVLLNDKLEAFYVTRAGEEYWSRRYNRAFGNGFFGSTSVAIKMNDTADFSIKGFVFDGRSTAEMVRKVGVQSVALIAASYGAPINLGKPAGSTSTSPTSFDTSDLVSDMQVATEKARAEEAAFRATLFRVADSVIANWEPLVKDGSAISRDIVAGTFNAYKNSWKAPPAQP